MNDKAMRAEAVAVANGKILAVGRRNEVMKLKGPNTQLVDLKGRTLVPGFVDAHGHIVIGGLQALSANLLAPPDGQVQDIASLQQTLRDWAQKNAAAVEKTKVIIGFGYDNAQLKELRHPTKEELDAVSTDIPVLIVHQSGHLATVNSAMLKAMGYDSSSKDPAGGVIQRKPGTTEPNGTLEETALFAAAPVVLGRIGPEGMKTFAREGASRGVRDGLAGSEAARRGSARWRREAAPRRHCRHRQRSARCTGGDAASWLALQANYDIAPPTRRNCAVSSSHGNSSSRRSSSAVRSTAVPKLQIIEKNSSVA